MGKLDFSKHSIEYDGKDYKIQPEGEDEKGAGGLWDMAGAFAVGVCNDIEKELGGFSLALPHAPEIIQEHTYNFVKYIVLEKLENQLNKIDLEKLKVFYHDKQYCLKTGNDGTYDGDLDDFAGAFADDVCNQVYGEPSDESAIGYDIIKADTCNLLKYVVLPQLAEQLNNKTSLEKCKVVYDSKEYGLKVNNNKTADGDLNDFAGAFANNICDQIYGNGTITEECRNGYAIIHGETQYLLESVVLRQLQKQLNNQAEM